MSSTNYLGSGGSTARPVVSARALWSGGLATAVVAALAYAVGVVIARGIFDVPILAKSSAGVLGDASTAYLMGVTFLATVLATGLLHVLLLTTPRPFSFFGWIAGLVTVLAAALPFTTEAELSAKVATSIINLVVGVIIVVLVTGVGKRALTGVATRRLH